MKERYTSPEVKLLCFAPAEKLARNTITFDELERIADASDNKYSGIIESKTDVVVDS